MVGPYTCTLLRPLESTETFDRTALSEYDGTHWGGLADPHTDPVPYHHPYTSTTMGERRGSEVGFPEPRLLEG